jgi:hypothetical protein
MFDFDEMMFRRVNPVPAHIVFQHVNVTFWKLQPQITFASPWHRFGSDSPTIFGLFHRGLGFYGWHLRVITIVVMEGVLPIFILKLFIV